MRISDWSSDGCSSDLRWSGNGLRRSSVCGASARRRELPDLRRRQHCPGNGSCGLSLSALPERAGSRADDRFARPTRGWFVNYVIAKRKPGAGCVTTFADRSEEHTSELQSLMRISYAVFCLKKKKKKTY